MTIWRLFTPRPPGRELRDEQERACADGPCCGEMLSGLGETCGCCGELGAFIHTLEERSQRDRSGTVLATPPN